MTPSTTEEAFYHMFDYLYLCGQNGVTLNPTKFKFCRKEIEFCGFYLSWDGFKPSEEMISSIKDFAMPENPTISDIRAWFGLINQLTPFLITTELMKPFRELLKSISKFVYWDVVLQSAFEQTKQEICKLIETGLACYDKERKTTSITDWSRDAIGFVLIQRACACNSDMPFCCENGWK